MTLGIPTFLPATPNGIVELLKRYDISTSGKNTVVLGRSNIVGTPISILMSKKKLSWQFNDFWHIVELKI